MDAVIRLLAVAVAAGAVLLIADRWQQLRRSRARTTLPAGIALVVTPACRLCEVVDRKLASLGVPYATVPADDDRLGSLVVRAAPALVRIGRDGDVETIRTGRAAIDRLDDVVAPIRKGAAR